MAATSNRNPSATKQASPATGGTAAGLTPIWIRLPRIGDADLAGDEPFDDDETARSSSRNRSAGPPESSRATDSGRERGRARSASPDLAEDDEALEEAPAYLREIAERQRAAALESREEIDEDAPAPRPAQGKRRSSKPETKSSGGFVTHLFRAPYNVLAGVALVAAFVGLYVCFQPGSASTDALPELDAGPSLTLDMGQVDSPPEPYVSAPEAVDPATLYPEPSLPSDGGFRPAEAGPSISGIASADYGAGTATAAVTPDFATTSPPIGGAPSFDGGVAGTPAINASSSVSATVDPAVAGLPLETYPETDPATYRYPADANFDLPTGAERTAEGVSAAPRAASLGDTLEKTPVR